MERFIRNGDFNKEIDNGNFVIKMFLINVKFIIKMFLIKHKLKISNFIKHHYNLFNITN